ncbi:MAG: RlmE family RNA methyltransferase [Deltaproteobacteria bacterium]|nr:RlmE family RNA methyltransferase [Deltaproteobacteria bacterium]MBW2019296.1 RlmE family RNA methyltransferase [Deltaproteobacteria bacterium]MBW2074083.1 RlmE family RNA methyltransferase [Deltaproteobacteria bacterium]
MYASVKSRPWDDYYARRAREDGYPARSVYKLEEIHKKFGILKRGSRVLDLGCSPGSWLLFASTIVGHKGLVVGVDVTPLTLRLPPNARFVQQNMLVWDESFLEAVGTNFETVLSDMAPSTTGSKFVDAQRSLELSESALAISARVLRPGGAFVCKIFHGPDFKNFSDKARKCFSRVVHFKPKSSKKASKETYLVGLGKIGG